METHQDKKVIAKAIKLCPTYLLDDDPSDEDQLAFAGDTGPHARVANAIADLIHSDEQGGKLIGLEGGWGAGKTTVIRLLQNKLIASHGISIFTFDAWAHEGDPLRRTFLESLINHFQTIGWISKSDWIEKIEHLAKRKRKSIIKSKHKLTMLGKLFATASLLIPIGELFAQSALHDGLILTINTSYAISWQFAIGALCLLAPLLVLLGNCFYLLAQGKETAKSSSGWAFLSGESETETTQDISETPEPTSIEFENYFRTLMKEALGPLDKKAVIVFDNLDRIEPKDALSIWSTLQTFLKDPNSKNENWFKKLWIIVPYDSEGLRQLWDNHSDWEDFASSNSGSVIDGLQLPLNKISDSFIDKSFQLRFAVAPPVLSNWKSYLENLIKKALPAHVEDRHIIFNVINLCHSDEGYPPTPREIKFYVNQIGVIHRQWQHEFPIGHIVYYVVLMRKYNHKKICEILRSSAFPHSSIETILDSELRANLAGMAFNVKASLGQQLLLFNPIHVALIKNEQDDLRELSIHADAFWAILERVAIIQFQNISVPTIVNIALCLEQTKILSGNNEAKGTVLNALKRRILEISEWLPFNKDIPEGIISACRLLSAPEVTMHVIEGLRKTFSGRKPNEFEIKTLAYILDSIKGLGDDSALKNPLTLHADAATWVEVCSYLKDRVNDFYFVPNIDFNDFSQYLCAEVHGGRFSNRLLTAIQVTQASPLVCKWDALSQAFGQRFISNNCSPEEYNMLLTGLSFIARNDCIEAKKALNILADNGRILHCLYFANRQNKSDVVLMCMIRFLEQRPDASPSPQTFGNSFNGYQLITQMLISNDPARAKTLVEILKAEDNLDLLFRIKDSKKEQAPLIENAIRIVAKKEEDNGSM